MSMTAVASPLVQPSVLDDLGEEVTGVIWPVSICMVVTIVLVRLLNPEGDTSSTTFVLASAGYDENADAGASDAKKLGGALLNAVIFVSIIVAMTFLLVLLFKWGCYKLIFAYLGFAVANVFFLITGLIIILLCQKGDVHIDAFSLAYILFNFSVVGTLGTLFTPAPLLMKQAYMVWIGIIVAYIFTWIPDWTGWVLLVCMALYDIAAVLIPGGPLKALVEMSIERQQQIPALVYESRPAAGGYRGPNHFARRGPGAEDGVADGAGDGAADAVDGRGGGQDVDDGGAPVAPGYAAAASMAAAADAGAGAGASALSGTSTRVPAGLELTSAVLPGSGSSASLAERGHAGAGGELSARGSGRVSETGLSTRRPHALGESWEPAHGDGGAWARPGVRLGVGTREPVLPPLPTTAAMDEARHARGAHRRGAVPPPSPPPLPPAPSPPPLPEPAGLRVHHHREHAACPGPVAESGSSSSGRMGNDAAHMGMGAYSGSPRAGGGAAGGVPPAAQRSSGVSTGGGSAPTAADVMMGLASNAVVPGGGPEHSVSRRDSDGGGAQLAEQHDAGQAGQPQERPQERRDGDDSDDDEWSMPDGIKLGLGDFIFYSMLVGKAATTDMMTVFASFIGIIAGLGITLLCLAFYQRALPALPFSIALGVLFYFLTRIILATYLTPLFAVGTYY